MDPIDPYYCATSTPTLAHFFDLSFAPTLLFYAYIPIILISLFFGLFVFFRDRQSLQSKLLLGLAISFVFWIINIILQWIAVYSRVVHFSAQITIFFETLIFILAIYFVYVFLNKKDMPFKLKLFWGAITTLIIALLPTRINTLSFDLINCESNVGILWQYIYILEAFSILYIIYLCFTKYFSSQTDKLFKKQIILFTFGITLFLTVFLFSNFYGELTQVYEFNLWGPLGMVAFLGLMTYMIVKFHTFNIKLVGAQALVAAIIILIGSEFFFLQVGVAMVLAGITLALALVAGVLLVRSVKREVEQRERLEILTKELGAANEKLKELDKIKSEFLGFASHQVKTPMSVVKGFASLIYDGMYGPVPQGVKDTAQKIKDSADKMVNLVNDLLDMRKLEEGKMDFRMEELDLNKFVGDIVNDLKTLADMKKLDLTFVSSVPGVKIKADPQKFHQIIQNYTENAIKYTPASPAGGPANWVKVAIDADKEDSKMILIAVTDSGLGMKKELIPKLFQQFSRDKDGTAVKILGTGLGLFIAKKIVEGHGGTTWAESDGEGKGSRFYVKIAKI